MSYSFGFVWKLLLVQQVDIYTSWTFSGSKALTRLHQVSTFPTTPRPIPKATRQFRSPRNSKVSKKLMIMQEQSRFQSFFISFLHSYMYVLKFSSRFPHEIDTYSTSMVTLKFLLLVFLRLYYNLHTWL